MGPFQEIAAGVFRRRYSSLDLNVGVVIGPEGCVLVDTRASHAQAAELLEELQELGEAPPRAIVNTHWHWDHVWGNAMFPGIPIWGHARCRSHMLEQGEKDRAGVLEWLPAEHHDTIRAVVITPPTRTFTAPTEIDTGGRPLVVHSVGLAHTDADVVVHVPDAGVVFAGDIVEEGAPPSFEDAFPLDWPAALERMLALDWDVAVPGHGDVVDRAFVERQRRQIAELAARARSGFSAGREASEVDVSGSPFGERASRTAVVRAYDQLSTQEPA
jgi:glyoxylase-like metal-dependent hydrolase (beta-lactamase superfamily II)